MTQGARVLVTRPPCDRAPLHHLLESVGYSAVSVPLYERRWRVDDVIRSAQQNPEIEHLVLTDPTCAEVLALAAPHSWGTAPITVLDDATAARAAQLGLRVLSTVTSKDSPSSKLKFEPPYEGTIAVLSPAHIPSPLRTPQTEAHKVVSIEAYEQVQPPELKAQLAEAIPVLATVLFDTLEAKLAAQFLSSHQHAELGHILCGSVDAAETARNAGLPVHSVAESPTVPGVVRTLRALYPIPVS